MHDQVTSLPGIGPVDNVQYAGYAPFTPIGGEKDAESLFYWFVGAENHTEQPTIIWTNGGPGSSSFWGFFLENGPYTIETALGDPPTLRPNPTGWNHYANYMIFEHPLSVTLSFANDEKNVPSDPEDGAKELYQALLHVVGLHPEIAKNPIILAGESYGGTYLPLLAREILDGNARGETQLDLRLTVLGDAWVDPIVQMKQNTNYAYTHGLISKKQKAELDKKYADDPSKTNSAIGEIAGVYMANIGQVAGPAFDSVLYYINREDVRKSLNVPAGKPLVDQSWSSKVSANYQHVMNKSFRHVVQDLLDRKHKI
ncbi:MAG: hypothetical protein AAF570_14205, partial [Bacteroidota bacterium]